MFRGPPAAVMEGKVEAAGVDWICIIALRIWYRRARIDSSSIN